MNKNVLALWKKKRDAHATACGGDSVLAVAGTASWR